MMIMLGARGRSTASGHIGGKLAGRDLRRIDLADGDLAGLHLAGDVQAQRRRPGHQRGDGSRRRRYSATRSPRSAAATAQWLASADLPVPAGPISSVLVPRCSPPPSSASSAGRPLLTARAIEVHVVLGGHQPGKHLQAAAPDDEVVKAAAEVHPAQLDHPQAPALAAVQRGQLLQGDHAVGDALQVTVGGLAGAIVQQQHGAAPPGEVLLQRQHLAPVAQRALGQQADLRQRVEHHPLGLDPVAHVEHRLGGLGQLDLGRVKQGVVAVAGQRVPAGPARTPRCRPATTRATRRRRSAPPWSRTG